MTEHDNSPIYMIASSELDFVTLIEHDVIPPIAAKDRNALDKWMKVENLKATPIGRRDAKNDILIISGEIRPWGYQHGLSYCQVWAHIDYDYYRNAIKFLLRTREGNEKQVHLYDADHAVGRNRLRNIWPNAWVNLLLVERSLNRAVGAMMEKDLLLIDKVGDLIKINAECIIKTFFARGGDLSRKNVASYFEEARDRFIYFGRSIDDEPISDYNELHKNLYTFLMSNNAQCFFDEIYMELGLELMNKPLTGLKFSKPIGT